MRRFLLIAMRILPVTGAMCAWGCGVTDRQLVDFATSTSIRVVVQALMSIVESAAVSGTGT
ncbi:MAG: hypothetical protein HRF43_05940 [Phycisphaerae bacterium]|jgi:hypothetical protein